MAVVVEKTFVVNSLGRGFEGQVSVSLSEHDENSFTPGMLYPSTGATALNLIVPESDAGKFLPGQLFKVALTPVKSA